MSQSPSFAEALMRNRTKLFFDTINYKIRFREPFVCETKGQVRSGKSTIAIAVAKYIAHITMVPFTLWHIANNEILYLEKLKDANLPDASSFVIDEQTESLSIEERITTDKGIIKLGDLKENQIINVLSYNFVTKRNEFVPASKVRNKVKPTYRITTENGKTVEATDNHIFFIKESGKIKGKILRELKEGDELICL